MVQKGQDFLWPSELGGNQERTITDVEDDVVKLSGPISGGDIRMRKGREYTVDEIRDNLDPREVHSNRPEAAREADAAKDAPLTTDPLEWASDPKHHDFPGVDTGPTFREAEGDDFDTESLLDFR